MPTTIEQLRRQLSAIEPNEAMYVGINSSEIPLLQQLFNDPEPWMSARAIFALSRIADDSAVAVIHQAIADPRPEVRVAIAASAANLALKDSNAILTELLDDPEVGVRKFAVQSISSESGPSIHAKLGSIEAQDPVSLMRDFARFKRRELQTSLVLVDNPIAYYRLNETSGATTAADLSGNSNHGTFSSGGITLGVTGRGVGDTAVLFSGGRIVVPNNATLNPGSITLEALINWFGDNGFQQRIIEKSRYIGGEESQYGLSILPDGKVMLEIQVDTVNSSLVSALAIKPGQVYHLAATYDGSLLRIYLDGDLDSEQAPALNGELASNSTNLSIGNQVDRDRPFNGIIDEVALYNEALSISRIKAHAAGWL